METVAAHARSAPLPEVSVRLVRPLFLRLHALGINVAELLGEVGAEPQILLGADRRISHDVHSAIWKKVEGLAPADPDLPCAVAEIIDARMLDLGTQVTEYVLVHLLANSATLGEGLKRYCRMYGLIHTRATLAMEVGRADGRARVTFAIDGASPAPALFSEYWIASTLRILGTAAVTPVRPADVFFAHAPRQRTPLRDRILGMKVRYDAGATGFSLAASDLSIAMAAANPSLLAIAERRAEVETEIARPAHNASIVAAVRASVVSELRAGRLSVARVVEHLGMSGRTVSRRLHEAGVSYKSIADDARKELANEYLRAGRLSVREISRLLGFADPSTFNRAYRRWFGEAPERRRGDAEISHANQRTLPVAGSRTARASAEAATPRYAVNVPPQRSVVLLTPSAVTVPSNPLAVAPEGLKVVSSAPLVASSLAIASAEVIAPG
jgi:AraC-like DNA-binding protein